jgi:Transposase IS116/IS110/IS902 family
MPLDLDALETPEEWIGALRLSRDLREAGRLLSPKQQRILVDLYYQIQDNRKATANQLRAAHEEPNAWITFMTTFMQRMEKLAAGGLDIASNQQAVSLWAKSIFGIGPVLAAGLAAYIDITRTPSVSALWSLAGLNPNAVWQKGEKRPWNAQLKVLRWKIGDSFMKFHNHPDCFYGHIYAARKVLEVERNAAFLFRDQAEKTLANRRIKDKATRAIYEAGQLPAGRLELRAERVAVKLFLSHYWEVAYYEHYHTLPRSPYILAKEPGLHRHYVPPLGYETIFTAPPDQRG